MGTRAARDGTSSGGWRGGRAVIVARSSSTRPTGPATGEPKAAGLVAWTLRAQRAAWSSPAKATRTPSPRQAGSAAAAAAARRFAGPSAPGADAGRIAPVKTTGASPPCSRSHRKAVSSSVSVPWVTTTPCPSRAAAPAAARAIASASSSERCAPGRPVSVTGRGAWASSRGTAATRAAASRAGSACSPAMAMVPPAARRWITRRFSPEGRRPTRRHAQGPGRPPIR